MLNAVTVALAGPFLANLVYGIFRRKADGERVIVLGNFLAVATEAGIVTAPTGFESDGLSIPPGGRKVIGDPFDQQWLAAGVIHDLLYREGVGFDHVTRSVADSIFRRLLVSIGIPGWKVSLIWLAIRTFGWMFFRKRRGAKLS